MAIPEAWVTVEQAAEMVGTTIEQIGEAVYAGLVRADDDGNVEMGQILVVFTPAADIEADASAPPPDDTPPDA